MNRITQKIKDETLKYFEEHGIELTKENGEAIPLDEEYVKDSPSNPWSINILVLTKGGPRWAYYRREMGGYTVEGIMPFDVRSEHASLLCNKFITDKAAFDAFYDSLFREEQLPITEEQLN